MSFVQPRTAPDDVATLPALDDGARRSLFTDARTAGSFTAVPVSDAELTEIWELTRWAPTSSNLQPLRVLFVRTPEGRERLQRHAADGNRARIAAAPVTAVLAVDDRFHETIPTVAPHREGLQAKLEENAAAREKLGGYNTALQAGYFILAVRGLGLAAGPMAGFDKAGVDAEFFAGTSWRSDLLVNIGHPAPDAYRPRNARLDVEDVLRFA